MNLNGVTGDSRKRLEAAAAAHPDFDPHPECLLCGRRDYHSHADIKDPIVLRD